ncbi:MAG TPA: TadE/TadG family type IV pilus assembly protein [Afifellaceae bacterium]|nr:TadE/TadG family type IV pilus assembly protein [Afifellaceae bacterium]
MSRWLQAAARLRRCESGAAAIEFAIVGSALIFVCLGTIEFGRGFYLRNQLSYVADCATRQILLKPEILDAELDEQVRERCPGTPANLPPFQTTEENGFRTVTLRQDFTPVLPVEAIQISVERQVPTS